LSITKPEELTWIVDESCSTKNHKLPPLNVVVQDMLEKIVSPISGAAPAPLCLLLDPDVPFKQDAASVALPAVCISISVQGTVDGLGVGVGEGPAQVPISFTTPLAST
jgi:hypothetical protein